MKTVIEFHIEPSPVRASMIFGFNIVFQIAEWQNIYYFK